MFTRTSTTKDTKAEVEPNCRQEASHMQCTYAQWIEQVNGSLLLALIAERGPVIVVQTLLPLAGGFEFAQTHCMRQTLAQLLTFYDLPNQKHEVPDNLTLIATRILACLGEVCRKQSSLSSVHQTRTSNQIHNVAPCNRKPMVLTPDANRRDIQKQTSAMKQCVMTHSQLACNSLALCYLPM